MWYVICELTLYNKDWRNMWIPYFDVICRLTLCNKGWRNISTNRVMPSVICGLTLYNKDQRNMELKPTVVPLLFQRDFTYDMNYSQRENSQRRQQLKNLIKFNKIKLEYIDITHK